MTAAGAAMSAMAALADLQGTIRWQSLEAGGDGDAAAR